MNPRERADVAHVKGQTVISQGDEFIVVGHAEVKAVAQDPDRFSSQVSAYLQIPNGLDGEEHVQARELIDGYLEPTRVLKYLPQFHAAAADCLEAAVEDGHIDDIDGLAVRYAVGAMQGWLQWPQHLTQRLVDWIDANNRARGSGDKEWHGWVAEEFDDIIRIAVEEAPEGSETHLLATQHGLEHAEIVSILRNWTAGDLGSMAKCIAVMAVAFADAPELQQRVRTILGQENQQEQVHPEFDAITNEILRLDNPFVSNRRITTCPVELGGTQIPEGARVHIHWTGANRDPKVFDQGFEPTKHAEDNLVWGTGPHFCPGKTVSLLELRAFWTEVLPRFEVVPVTADGHALQGMRSVDGGWDKAPVRLAAR